MQRNQAAWASVMQSPPVAPLMEFHTARRALLRVRQAIAHLLDPEPRTPQKWQPLTRRDVEWALAALESFETPPPALSSTA